MAAVVSIYEFDGGMAMHWPGAVEWCGGGGRGSGAVVVAMECLAGGKDDSDCHSNL